MLEKINFNSMTDYLSSLKSAYGPRVITSYFEDEWQFLTYDELIDKSIQLATFLKNKNCYQKTIALICEPRPEVIITILACSLEGVKLVPIDIKLTSTEIANILNDISAEFIITSPEQSKNLFLAQKETIKKSPVLFTHGSREFDTLSTLPRYDSVVLEKRDPKNVSIVIFTSGSTGAMKGVETTTAQLLFQASSLSKIGMETGNPEVKLAMLPFSHLFQITCTLAALTCGYEICIAHALEKEALNKCFIDRKPTVLITVPLFLTKLKNGILDAVRQKSTSERIAFKTMCSLSKVNTKLENKRKVFCKILENFGGRLHRIIVGGAAMDKSTIEFFSLLGIPIYEGYGLTETGPVISVNRVDQWRPGTVGKLLPGVEVKISKKENDDIGEILTKGPHLMKGYLNQPEMTSEAIDTDGWFKTGDIGKIDRDGFLHITGRSKSMLVLENGKKVFPEEVEAVLSKIRGILESSVIGANHKLKTNSSSCTHIVAIIVVDIDTSPADAILLKQEIIQNCQVLSSYKRPSEIIFTKEELPKTTTMKVKSFKVRDLYINKQIAQMSLKMENRPSQLKAIN